MAILIPSEQFLEHDKYPEVVNKLGYFESIQGGRSSPYIPTAYNARYLKYRYHPAHPQSKIMDPSKPQGAFFDNMILRNRDLEGFRTKARNKAMMNYRKKLSTNNGFVETMYERQKSVDLATSMIRSTNKGLKRLTRDIKRIKRNPASAKLILQKYPQELRSYIEGADSLSSIPSAWLAYNFGIAPTIDTINSTLHLMCEDFPLLKVAGKTQLPFKTSSKSGDWYDTLLIGNIYGIVQSSITGVNPNAYLAQNLGVFMPSTLWELVPWSWFVDYGTNLGDFITNFDPAPPGLLVEDKFYVVYTKINVMEFRNLQFERLNKTGQYAGEFGEHYGGTYSFTERKRGLPAIALETPSLEGLSIRQFSYAISALALTFKSGSKKITH